MNNNNKEESVTAPKLISLEDDFALIQVFKQGNEAAFRALVNRHKEKVRNLIFLTVGNADAVDDLAQEVFITVYRKLHTFRFESRFTTWLYRITVNKCRDHLRKVRIKSIFTPLQTDDSGAAGTSAINENFDRAEIVRAAVARLPEKLRVPLLLKDFEGMNYQDIAETLGTEVGTIKSRIFRARESLRVLLQPYYRELA